MFPLMPQFYGQKYLSSHYVWYEDTFLLNDREEF